MKTILTAKGIVATNPRQEPPPHPPAALPGLVPGSPAAREEEHHHHLHVSEERHVSRLEQLIDVAGEMLEQAEREAETVREEVEEEEHPEGGGEPRKPKEAPAEPVSTDATPPGTAVVDNPAIVTAPAAGKIAVSAAHSAAPAKVAAGTKAGHGFLAVVRKGLLG